MTTFLLNMADRYLLYIDILGFSDLVAGSDERIRDLYEVIASLNVHRHPSFRAIIFSDTLLVYNVEGQDTRSDRSYLVMYLCEFAQDLQRRLTKKDIFFRAVLVRGEFNHYELNQLPCFFGQALIDAHESEKKIKAIGLFMHKSIIEDSVIFSTAEINEDFSFVFITQHLTTLEEEYGGLFPVDSELIEDTDQVYLLTPEVLYLGRIAHFASSHSVPSVRAKYEATLDLFRHQYPETISFLEGNGFDVRAISPSADWSKAIAQWPQEYGWAVKERIDH